MLSIAEQVRPPGYKVLGRCRAVVLAILVAAALVPTAGAYSWCGSERYGVELRFHNPDLNPWNDPAPQDVGNNPQIVEGSWHVLIQFQAVVNDSHPVARDRNLLENIDSFWFGFGPIKEVAVAGPFDNCEKPWTPGIQFYSTFSDVNPEDGFHVGLNTTLVPDGTYGAAVYACTGSSEEQCMPGGRPGYGNPNLVAAGWSRVLIYNGEDECQPEAYRCQRKFDFVKPWPKILPGDGNQTNTGICDDPKRCLTIKFEEDIRDLSLTVNGVNRTDELEGPNITRGLGYSETYRWPAPRPFQRNDEIRVRATDGAGNVAQKTISFRDESRGAVVRRIDAKVDVTVTPPRQRVRPGESKTFQVSLANKGNDTAHVFPTVNASSQVSAKIADDHIDVQAQSNVTVLLQAGPTDNASLGEHPIELVFDYQSGIRRRTTKAYPTVVADPDATLAARDDGNETTEVQELPSGFARRCSEQGRFEVCILTPGNLTANRTFTAEAQVAVAAPEQEQRHDVDAGEAKLRFQYLDAAGEATVAPDDAFPMRQVDKGQYRANVSLSTVAPTLNAVFASERVTTSVLILQPAPEATGGATTVPGFSWLALAALCAAAVLARRRR